MGVQGRPGRLICPPAGPSRPRVWAHLPSPPLPPWPWGALPWVSGPRRSLRGGGLLPGSVPTEGAQKRGAAAASPQSWGSPVATVGEAQAPALRAQGTEDRERTCRHPDRSHQRCGRQQTHCWTQGAAVTGLRVGGGLQPGSQGPGPRSPAPLTNLTCCVATCQQGQPRSHTPSPAGTEERKVPWGPRWPPPQEG